MQKPSIKPPSHASSSSSTHQQALSKLFTKLLCLSEMALKTSLAVLLSLNLLFFATLSSSSAAPPPQPSSCQIDIFKLGVCADLLGGLVPITIGSPAQPCCSLLRGLIDLEAAVCLCTAIKANVLGINLDIPVDLSVILNRCGKKVPSGFQCP